MLNRLSHLSKNQLTTLRNLTHKIIEVIKPEKIMCYGSRTTIAKDWTIFGEDDVFKKHTYPTTYDLVIITNADEKKEDHELIQTIEQQAAVLNCDVTSVILKTNAFSQALEAGWRFFTTAYSKGIMLYDSNANIFYAPVQPFDNADLKRAMEAHWNQCFPIAQRFYKTAEGCIKDNWPEQALFNLHQSAQHTCMALLRSITGYRSTTHNLSRLLALIENFTMVPTTVFPCFTTEETELFNLLNKAYSEARYKESYTVPLEVAKVLKGRVKELMTVTEDAYRKRLASLVLPESISFPVTVDKTNSI